jgi:large subunit ribosomal protein L25
MAEIITLLAQKRDAVGRKTDELRAQNLVPAVLYGFGTEPVMVQVNRGDFGRVYAKTGESTIVELDIEGTKHPVLVQDVSYDPLTDEPIHIDFRRINMDEKVETTIAIKLVGISPAVKDLGGTLVQSLEEVEVSALPSALVREIELNITPLATFDDVLRVSDMQIPQGIEILTDAQETVALVQAAITEDQIKAMEAQATESIENVAKQEAELAKAKEEEKAKE